MTNSSDKTNKNEIENAGAPDDTVYCDAVRFINSRVEKGKRNLLEIGEYLLEHFFGGDIEAVKSKKPGKGPSIRQLAERDDIDMSRTDLSRAVNLAAQEKEIGTVPTSGQLTLSHKEVLLGVPDLETKKRYVEIAVEEGLSVRQLEARLKKDGITGGEGSEEDPEKTATREHRHLVKTFDFLSSFSTRTLKGLDADTAQSTLAKAEEAQQGLAKVIEVLRKKTEAAMKKSA